MVRLYCGLTYDACCARKQAGLKLRCAHRDRCTHTGYDQNEWWEVDLGKHDCTNSHLV